MSLTGKWIDLIYKVAVGSWRTRLIVAPIAGALFLTSVALFILFAFMADTYLGFPRIIVYPWSSILGYALIALGSFLAILSIAYFIRVGGSPVPLSPPPKLITTGLYGFSRNPMLSGISMLLFGLGIVFGSLSLVFIFTPLFIAVNVWELKKIEEPELVKRLGQEYVEYRKRVPMFFPLCMKRRNVPDSGK